MSQTSLKSSYQKWLFIVATADALSIAFFCLPRFPGAIGLHELATSKILSTIIVPVAVLLTVNLLSQRAKFFLLYWRRKGWMPGCEAFSRYGPADPRVDMVALGKNLGWIPADPRQQNSRWYGLFNLVKTESAVQEIHRSFLMYRDLACLSAIFTFLTPLTLLLLRFPGTTTLVCAAIFAAQYLLTAVSARSAGIRFVGTVLALHSAKSYRGAKKAAP